MALTVRGGYPTSVFHLNGTDENSATFALGWVLEHSPTFRKLLIDAVFQDSLDVTDSVVALQKFGAAEGGFTDVEVQAGLRFHVILEAKLGFNLPSIEQFRLYRPRLTRAGARKQCLVSVNTADESFAKRRLPAELDGVPIQHLSWSTLRQLARRAHTATTGIEEKLWLRHLGEHLQEFISMGRQTDNRVFVVALSDRPMIEGKKATWIDVVKRDRSYFHPVGNRWPVEPPNYIGFRYHGQLQSVHHIDSYEVLINVAERNMDWFVTDSEHFVYRLGPAMRPPHVMKAGDRVKRNARVWCALDTLLSGACLTLSDAKNETDRRLADGS